MGYWKLVQTPLARAGKPLVLSVLAWPPCGAWAWDGCHWRREARNQPTPSKKRMTRSQRKNVCIRALTFLTRTLLRLFIHRSRQQHESTRRTKLIHPPSPLEVRIPTLGCLHIGGGAHFVWAETTNVRGTAGHIQVHKGFSPLIRQFPHDVAGHCRCASTMRGQFPHWATPQSRAHAGVGRPCALCIVRAMLSRIDSDPLQQSLICG